MDTILGDRWNHSRHRQNRFDARIPHYPGAEFYTEISECGAFTTYKPLKDWFTTHYSTADSINPYRDRFLNCHQQNGESFDDYFKRFREARGTLEIPFLKRTLFTSSFVTYFLRTISKFVEIRISPITRTLPSMMFSASSLRDKIVRDE